MAARPRAVMHSASGPRSSLRRQAGSMLPAGTSSTNPSFRSLPIAFLARLPFGFPARSIAPSSRCAAADSSTSWVSVSLFADMIGISIRLGTASCAVTTEAPHWRHSRRGRIRGGPTALNHAATVTLCSHRKASHFWRMLLLVSGPADHGMILHQARPYPASGGRTHCLASRSRLWGMSSSQEPLARRARWQADVAVLAGLCPCQGILIPPCGSGLQRLTCGMSLNWRGNAAFRVGGRTVIGGEPWDAFNPGSISIAA